MVQANRYPDIVILRTQLDAPLCLIGTATIVLINSYFPNRNESPSPRAFVPTEGSPCFGLPAFISVAILRGTSPKVRRL